VTSPELPGDATSTAIACELLAREGHLLDQQRWDDWLALYREDCQFWLPTWKSEHELVGNPMREVSLIFLESRAGLEDRVVRIRSRKSVTAMPLPRTAHFCTNVLARPAGEGTLEGLASWQVHAFDPRTKAQHGLWGRYEFTLRQAGPAGPWQYQRKKVVICNDLYPAVVDFYSV
jgi:3-phenylpropionate/cinnamic acid dioxygenase small subunit